MGRRRHHRRCEQSWSAARFLRRAESPSCSQLPTPRAANERSAHPRRFRAAAPCCSRCGRYAPKPASIAMFDLVTRTSTDLFRGGTQPRYTPAGQLVYATEAGTLEVVPFDPERREVRGEHRHGGDERDGQPERHRKLRRVRQRHARLRAGRVRRLAPPRVGNARRPRAAFVRARAPIHVPAACRPTAHASPSMFASPRATFRSGISSASCSRESRSIRPRIPS